MRSGVQESISGPNPHEVYGAASWLQMPGVPAQEGRAVLRGQDLGWEPQTFRRVSQWRETAEMRTMPRQVLSNPTSAQKTQYRVSSGVVVHIFAVTFYIFDKKYQMRVEAQLSNLWWIPNSVSICFSPVIKTGSSRRFKRFLTTHVWLLSASL